MFRYRFIFSVTEDNCFCLSIMVGLRRTGYWWSAANRLCGTAPTADSARCHASFGTCHRFSRSSRHSDSPMWSFASNCLTWSYQSHCRSSRQLSLLSSRLLLQRHLSPAVSNKNGHLELIRRVHSGPSDGDEGREGGSRQSLQGRVNLTRTHIQEKARQGGLSQPVAFSFCADWDAFVSIFECVQKVLTKGTMS
jgi:hypothetical protein